jgi:TatD family-associated radical SAM protein
MLWLAARLKEMGNYTLRVNTNGLADCITGRNAAPEMHGLLDIVSVSLNAPTAEKYDAVCHSKYGPEAFDAMLHFTAEAVKNVPHVVMTVVSTMPAEDIEACRKLCENAGAKFRVREYISE